MIGLPNETTTLRVEIWFPVIEDGTAAPPRVGDVGDYTLSFRDADDPDPSDLSVIMIEAIADSAGPPYRGADGIQRWPTELHGLGWRVVRDEFRPRIGPVRLHGSFHAEFYGVDGVRARITRVQIESMEMRRPTGDNAWMPVRGTRQYRDVDEAPRWVYDENRDPAGYRLDRAVIVDLDLTDIPALPPRPRVCPDAVAVDGDRVWVIDRELPIVVQLDLAGGNAPTEHLLPGAVTTKEDCEIPSLWAAAGACWAFRSDGVFRIAAGSVTRVTSSPVDSVVPGDRTALVALREEGNTVRLHLIEPGDVTPREPVHTGDAPRWGIATDTGFLLLTCNGEMAPEDRTHRLVRVGEAGEVTVGPVLDDVGPNPDGFGGAPPRVFTGGMIGDPIALDVRPDLTITRSARTAPRFGSVRTVGNDLFVVCHRPDGTGAAGWWPLDGPCEYRSEEQFWLLVRLDGDTLEPVAVAPIHTTQVSIARHGDELLVATGAHLFRWRGTGFSELEEIPLAAGPDQYR